MLKILGFMGLFFFLIFFKKSYWMGQSFIFFLFFLMIMFLDLNFYIWGISYSLGMDVLSYGLILLTMWICALMLMSSGGVKFRRFFMFMIIVLMVFLVLTFMSLNFLLFYLFFEMSLIPTILLILGWGYQPERLQAGLYLLFYTLFGSLPLLLGIFFLMDKMNSLNMGMFLNLGVSWVLYLSLIMAFLVKMPMYLVHLWLPKAHVEAPVSGSMILAAVLLKLGGYGILRVMGLFQQLGLKFNFFWIGVSLIGGILVSLICLRQIDLKSLVAYSSVAHMGLALSGIMTMSFWGLQGGFIMMISHGLCSSGLFCLVNLVYERTSSRSLLINKGLMSFLPSLSLWWFLLCSCNMAAPPSINLLSEVLLLNSLVSWSYMSLFSISLISFFSAAYTLYLYSYSQHGVGVSSIFSFFSVNCLEILLLFLHWVPINLFILKSDLILNWL